MPDFRESLFWDKELETELPDCRLSYSNREKRTVTRGRMQMDVVFCSTCHKENGLVPVHCPHVWFQCDDCFAKMLGALPSGAAQVPEETVKGWGAK